MTNTGKKMSETKSQPKPTPTPTPKAPASAPAASADAATPKAPPTYKSRFNVIAKRLARQHKALHALARSRSKPTDDERARAIKWLEDQHTAILVSMRGASTATPPEEVI